MSPKLCGENSGSHLYIDAGAGREEEAGLTATISQSATWRIKVTIITTMGVLMCRPASPWYFSLKNVFLKQWLRSPHLPVKVGEIK